MKRKTIQLSAVILLATCLLSSCYTYTAVVGKGPQGSETLRHKNHYLIDGLVPLKTSDAKAMAGDSKDYSVTVTHTFIDGLLAAITGGIYTPTTTIVAK